MEKPPVQAELGLRKNQSPEQEATSEMSITRAARAFQVSTTNREITAHAGAVLIREAATAVGLGPAIEEHLHLKARASGFTEAQSILAIAEAVALGAGCLDDLVVVRADVAQEQLRGFAVPAPQTAGAFLKRFTVGHIASFDKALRQVHLRAFDLAGVGEGDRVSLDFDSTYIRSKSSRRQGADRTYLKRYALHPLFCHVAEHGTVLHARLRRGSAHTANGIDSFVDECLKRVPEGAKVRARFDSGFYSSDLLASLERKKVTYLCGVWLTSKVLEAVGQIPDHDWIPCADKDEGEVAEFRLTTGDDPKLRRFVVKRIAKDRGEQLDLETGGYHYWVLVTNDHRSSAVTLESEHRHKAQIEGTVMRELKENFGLDVLRKHGFMANWAWILLVVAGLNLIRWTQLLGDLQKEGELRAKRFRYRYLAVPALLVSSGGMLTLKLRSDYPLMRRFITALKRLRRLALRR